jgi:hypothetical protein
MNRRAFLGALPVIVAVLPELPAVLAEAAAAPVVTHSVRIAGEYWIEPLVTGGWRMMIFDGTTALEISRWTGLAEAWRGLRGPLTLHRLAPESSE